jgi:transcription initiation factor TFIID subunit TAF12
MKKLWITRKQQEWNGMIKESKRELEARVWLVDAWELLEIKCKSLSEFLR